MTNVQPPTDPRRGQPVGIDDQKVVIDDESDVTGHRLAGNDNETVVDDLPVDAAD
jgi:hypothetical protein